MQGLDFKHMNCALNILKFDRQQFTLKGVFAKNERGYRHTAKNKRY